MADDETPKGAAERAWWRCASYEYRGRKITWSQAHQRLYLAIAQAAQVAQDGVASIFLWVGSHGPKGIEVSLGRWLDGKNRREMMLNAISEDYGDGFDELNKLAATVEADLVASRNTPAKGGGGDESAAPGK